MKWTSFVLVLACSACAPALAEPLGDWPLAEDGLDHSGNERHAVNHGVLFGSAAPDGTPAARFNGRDAWLEVPAGTAPTLGEGDFTITLWVYTEKALNDAVGDLLSQFDPDLRRGFTLGIADYGGVSNSRPNHRNLFFSADDGTEPVWRAAGRPGNAVFVFGFAVHEGDLYAATCEPGEGEAGRVYRHTCGTDWVDCGNPDNSNAVMALAVHEGHLYAGTGWYDTTGSALEASPNTTPGGKVYRYEGGTEWTFCGHLANPETGEGATMGGLGVFRGKLHATTLKQEGFGLYRYEGGTEWTWLGHPGRRVLNPTVFNNDLYMVSYDAPGGPFRYNGKGWAYVGASIDPPIHQDYAFAVYGGRLHLSTWPQAYVYRMEESGDWTAIGRPGDELETMGMMVYNGKLYTGTLPSSKVYRYDGNDVWTPIGKQLDTAEGKYRRAWSMALYDGKLFCGTLPSGNVLALEAGTCLTHDHALAPGWRHIAATRQNGVLRLYVDGVCMGTRGNPDGPQLRLADDRLLTIGFGPGDYFNGWMRNLRVYQRGLSETEIAALAEVSSLAKEMAIPYVQGEITLSKNRIVAGEPVNLRFSFTNSSNREISLGLSDSYDLWDEDKDNRLNTESLKIAVVDDKGNEVPRRDLPCRPYSQFTLIPYMQAEVAPGATVVVEYPLHLRVSTQIPPGHYRVIVKAFQLQHSNQYHSEVREDGVTIGQWESLWERFVGPALPLEVEPFDETRLTAVYKALMEEAGQEPLYVDKCFRCTDDYSIRPALRSILWAEGPVAVPFQIAIMYGSQWGFRVWPPALVNTWANIVQYAERDQIDRVLEMARHPECIDMIGRGWGHYTPGLAWAIHEWHRRGAEELRQHTAPLVKLFPHEELCPTSLERGMGPYGMP